jgi:predicted anti-sigma-YlaC factor YlaD
MQCVHMQEMIQRRLDGDRLAQQDEDRLAAHLVSCTTCRSFAHDLERVAGLVKRLPLEPAPRTLEDQVMQQVAVHHAPPNRLAAGLEWVGRSWAPLAGLAGTLVLIYQIIAVHGVSLLDLPSALAEWAALVDPTHLESLLQATSLLAWSVGAELLLGISLVIVAVFAVMAQAVARPPAIRGRRPDIA